MATAKKAAKKKPGPKKHDADAANKAAPQRSDVLDDSKNHIADISAEGQQQQKAQAKPGRKRQALSVEERLDRVEGLYATLVRKLRPHGIHLGTHDEPEQQDAATE